MWLDEIKRFMGTVKGVGDASALTWSATAGKLMASVRRLIGK